jgi:hypothetical protein
MPAVLAYIMRLVATVDHKYFGLVLQSKAEGFLTVDSTDMVEQQ